MDLQHKRILVTGATGLIGSRLVEILFQEKSATVVVMGRSQKKMAETFARYVGSPRFCILEHNVSSPFPEQLGAVDVVFHAAGPMERDVVLNKPTQVVLPNILGAMNCMEYARKIEQEQGKKVRLVMFSSITVYHNSSEEDLVVTEDMSNGADRLDAPTIAYSESKRMVETIAQAYVRQYGVDAVIARLSTVYGYTYNIPDTAFYEFIRKSLSGQDIELRSSTLPHRDNIYVDDAIAGLIQIACAGVSGEAYNVSSGGAMENGAAVDELAVSISKIAAQFTGKPAVKVILPPSEGVRRPGLLLSNAKLTDLGWSLQTDLQTGLTETVKQMAFRLKNNELE